MKQLGIYTIDGDAIGIGGMGKIYRGHDKNGHIVAIKEIDAEFANDHQMRYYIEKEVKVLWGLDHPSIVKIYTSCLDKQTSNYYIIMEFVDGMNVEQYVKKNGPMSEDMAKRVLLEILSAMQHVHYHGIIHRDIKPSNIMIRENGSVCLLDFGVAKDMNSVSGTISGSIIGSTGYMSPEQAEGNDIDTRSDIYAIGCVLYFMLTGHHAFNTYESEFVTKDEILNKSFPRLSKYRKDCSNILQQILDKATDRNMMHRYQSCTEFISALRNDTFISDVQEDPIRLTIGREKCDITICDKEQRISRHHADVELKEFTGGRYYVFTDTSANGTVINGKRIHHESVKLAYDSKEPEIYLAGSYDARLDWSKVVEMLQERATSYTLKMHPERKNNQDDFVVSKNDKKSNSKKLLFFGVLAGILMSLIIILIMYFFVFRFW